MLHTWHKIESTDVSSLEENKIIEISIGGKRIALLRKGVNLYAFTALCPHAGAPLCEGWVDPLGRIVCPDHKYRFDPANGRNTSGEGHKLFTYPIEIKGEELFIGLPS